MAPGVIEAAKICSFTKATEAESFLKSTLAGIAGAHENAALTQPEHAPTPYYRMASLCAENLNKAERRWEEKRKEAACRSSRKAAREMCGVR